MKKKLKNKRKELSPIKKKIRNGSTVRPPEQVYKKLYYLNLKLYL